MVLDIEKHRGIYQFGPAYGVMLANDLHPVGSVDRVLLENMIRLNPQTVDFLYNNFTSLEVKYHPRSRPTLEKYVEQAVGNRKNELSVVQGITKFCEEIALMAENTGPDNLIVGGTEEEIIERKTDWCTDLSRAGCALFQAAGFPSRMAYLFDISRAYSGHAIIEVFWKKQWGAVDPTHGLVYLDFNGQPAGVLELQGSRELVLKNELNPYPDQFKEAALANYFIREAESYNYPKAKVNQYYRTILEMAEKGWPGGLRWLHNEDE